MQHIVDRNQEVLGSFVKAIEELSILRDNLLKKEVSKQNWNCVGQRHEQLMPSDSTNVSSKLFQTFGTKYRNGVDGTIMLT